MVMENPETTEVTTATDELLAPTIAPNEEPASKKKKKKARYSKARKRELKQQKLEQEEEERRLKVSKKRKRTKGKANATQTPVQDPPKDAIDRILRCAEKSLFTDSVVVENRTNTYADIGGSTITEKKGQLVVEILSGCDLSDSDQNSNSANEKTSTFMGSKTEPLSLPSMSANALLTRTVCTIKVQPLLVLDLNGILCHRDRKQKRSDFWQSLKANVSLNDWKLRPSIGSVANTAIIPRTDLLELLRFLDKHFCLAIWTSAKAKTAKKLLNMLLSGGNTGNKYDCKGIRSRLLFVWSQSQCTAVRTTGREAQSDHSKSAMKIGQTNTTIPASSSATTCVETVDPPQLKDDEIIIANKETMDDDEYSFDESLVYEKHLPKIWESYPLWSANNTLLMDDSPEKCPMAVANAIHPPPLHGRDPTNPYCRALSDQDNEKRQSLFFKELVSFWADSPYREPQQPGNGTGTPTTSSIANAPYYNFLQQHAKDYMGWRGN